MGQAGLLAAVISAFIIYIHPQLRPDPNEETAALLRVLLYKTDNATFGDEIPEVPHWTGPPRTTVAAQLLLYLSLATTLTSVLVAILAKQMLNHHASTYTKITICAPAVRRFFFVFVYIAALGPLFLLQVALLLFSCAIPVYLWRINVIIASFMFVTTLCSTAISLFTGWWEVHNFAISIRQGISSLRADRVPGYRC